MKDGYLRESRKLDALAEAMALVAKEFEKTKESDTAVAGYVICGLIMRQIDILDKQLDVLIESTGI